MKKNPTAVPGYETPDYGVLVKIDRSKEARDEKRQFSAAILNPNGELIYEIKDQPRFHYLMSDAARFLYDAELHK